MATNSDLTNQDVAEKKLQNLSNNQWNNTIVAPATPMTGSAVGVIRISGPLAFSIIVAGLKKVGGDALFSDVSNIEPRRVYHGCFCDSKGNFVDEVLVHLAKNPRSYTGEDTAEINCHGGSLIMRRVLDACLGYGARMAEGGEFTRRSFLHGKMDLVRAEAIPDLSSAVTDVARQSAFRQLRGAMAPAVEKLQDQILDLDARVEAWIDFPEDDVDLVELERVKKEITEQINFIKQAVTDSQREIFLREGIDLGIVGRPNVGKSSIFNRLCKEERVIVSEIPGTTRDVITETLSFQGIPVRIHDTAGIHQTEDSVEQKGVILASSLIERMDLLLVVLDSSEQLTTEDENLLKMTENFPRIILLNKQDLPVKLNGSICPTDRVIHLSALTDQDIEHLVTEVVATYPQGLPEGLVVTNARHLECLNMALGFLEEAENAATFEATIDIVAEGLRSAARAISEILGANYTEDLLDRIFSKFCIGK